MKAIKTQEKENPGPISIEFANECKRLLLEKKEEILNQVRVMKSELHERSRGGDEADQSVEILAEHQFLTAQNRLNKQLLEIEGALARIQAGTYGICEETDEFIELDRLRAIPWTRLSIEGAEIREALKKRFAR